MKKIERGKRKKNMAESRMFLFCMSIDIVIFFKCGIYVEFKHKSSLISIKDKYLQVIAQFLVDVHRVQQHTINKFDLMSCSCLSITLHVDFIKYSHFFLSSTPRNIFLRRISDFMFFLRLCLKTYLRYVDVGV